MNTLGQVQDTQEAEPVSSVDATDLTARSVRAFGDISERLFSIRQALSNIGNDIQGYAALADPGEENGETIRLLADRSATVLALLTQAEDSERIKAFDAALGTAGDYLHAVHRSSQTLSAVATLSRATAGSYGIATLNTYLNELSGIAKSISNDVTYVNESLSGVLDCNQMLRAFYSEAVTVLQRMNTVIVDMQTMTDELSREEQAVALRITHEADRLKKQSHNQIKGLMSSVQFADRLAQRVDHLGTILSHDDPHARKLAVAQMISIAEAMRQSARETSAGASDLSELAKAGQRLFVHGDVAETVNRSVSARGEAARNVAVDVAHVTSTLDRMRENLAQAEDVNSGAQKRFEGLERSAKMVATASINSVLLAARAQSARGALTMLSSEVRVVATECLAAVGGCQAAMNSLNSIVGNTQDTLLSAMADLTASSESFQSDVRSGAERLETLNTLCDDATGRADALGAEVADLCTAMADVETLADAMAQQAAQIAEADMPNATPNAELLAEIWDLYTMDEERLVHAQVFSDFSVQTADSGPADDIDDLLF